MRKKADSSHRKSVFAMRYACALCMLLSLAVWCPVHAADGQVLTYKLVGLQGAPLRNARAWLGAGPDNAQQRANFLATAESRVEDSLKALGYYNSEIRTELNRIEPVWSLQITVDLGPPVLIAAISVELQGAARDDTAFQALVNNSPLVEGNVFNHGEFERFKNQILTLGQQRGYFDAHFNESRVTVNVLSNRANIYLHYESGPRFRFGSVQYSESGLNAELLRQLQPVQVGEYFDQSKLQFFQAQLQNTRFFSAVIIKPLLDETSNYHVPLSVEFFPARRHSFDVGLGYSTDTEERVSMVWRTPLLNRYGHSQQTRLAYSEVNPSGQFTYTIPVSHPLNDVVHLTALVEQNEFGDIDSEQRELGVQREIRGSRWLYSYSIRGLEESWELSKNKFENNYLLPGLSFSRSDRSGSVVDPDSGFSQLYQFEGGIADVGSDIDLLRVKANFSYIQTLAPAHRFVARAALGAVFISDDDRVKLAPSLSFFAGGSHSIRGYGYQSIGNEIKAIREDGSTRKLVVGGDRLLTATLEYQYYFTETWRGAVFVDAGDAFDSTDFEVNVGPGFGVHYISPVGAVRLEFANSASDDNPSWRMVLNIGAEF